MRSLPAFCVVAVLSFSLPAVAYEPLALDAPTASRSASLVDWHHASPAAPGFRSSGSADLVLNGLLLVGIGVVAGGAGFGLMYACPEGSGCYSQSLMTVAWVLAAPGIIPLLVGATMIYIGSPHYRSDALVPARAKRWSFFLSPTPGGGALGALGSF